MKRGLSMGDLSTSAPVDADSDPQCFTQVSTRSKKARKNARGQAKSSKAANNQLSSTAGDAVCPVTDSQPQIEALENEVESLRATVRSLESKLDRVLSFLGLNSTESIELSTTSYATAAASIVSSDITQPVPDTGVNHSSARHSERVQPATLKDVVLNAIHRDSKTRENRAKSIVISGLEVQSGLSDVNNVMQLFSNEFNFQPKIVYCKRLGSSRIGHIQPVLVAFTTQHDASWFIANARQLRQSHQQQVREKVFINANLTKVQSREAYERRCLRRAAATSQASDTAGSSEGGDRSAGVVLNVNNTRHADDADDGQRPTTSLSATCKSFIPSSVGTTPTTAAVSATATSLDGTSTSSSGDASESSSTGHGGTLADGRHR